LYHWGNSSSNLFCLTGTVIAAVIVLPTASVFATGLAAGSIVFIFIFIITFLFIFIIIIFIVVITVIFIIVVTVAFVVAFALADVFSVVLSTLWHQAL